MILSFCLASDFSRKEDFLEHDVSSRSR